MLPRRIAVYERVLSPDVSQLNPLEVFEFSTIPMTHATPGSPASTHSSLEDEEDVGVGLSDRKLSEGRRHMLDLINRLHSTG